MIAEPQQEQASLYALGALSPAEQAAFETELTGNPGLRALARDLQSTIALVALTTPAFALPTGLKDNILRRIGKAAPARKPAPALPALQIGLDFISAASKSGWKQLPIQGAYIKLLSLEPNRGYAVLLGKLEPGARYPAHFNAGPEDFYVLTGDLVVGDRKLEAGDFHHADEGSQHEENYSIEGCTLIAVLTTADPLVAFAVA